MWIARSTASYRTFVYTLTQTVTDHLLRRIAGDANSIGIIIKWN